MEPERLAALRARADGAEWQDVRLFSVLMSDGSSFMFPAKTAPMLPKTFERDGDGAIVPVVWSTRVPLYCTLRLDHVIAISEVEVPAERHSKVRLEDGTG